MTKGEEHKLLSFLACWDRETGISIGMIEAIKKGGMCVDLTKLKKEYITTDISYRKLAEKYGVPKNRIAEIGKKEGWSELRGQFRDKTMTKIMEKTSENKAKQAAKVCDLADKLLLKLEKAIDELDITMVTQKTKVKEVKYGGGEACGKPIREIITEEENLTAVTTVVDRLAVRQLTSALRDLQAIKGELNELERREREARIELLHRQSERDKAVDNGLIVELEGGLDVYAK